MIKRIAPHLLGSLLVISTVYHSNTLYSLLAAVPIFLISYFVEKKNYEFVLPVLVAATSLQFLFISGNSPDDVFALIAFSISFALPLLLYWLVLLSGKSNLSWKPLGVALSYVIFTFVLFYLLPDLIGVSEYIMGEQNEEIQILMFLGSAMLVGVVYHAGLEIID